MAGRGQRGRGGRGAAGGRGRGRQVDAQKDPLQHVAKFRFFAKAAMAPYPAEDGCPFYLKDADDEKSFFKKGFIACNVVAPDNCEALWRLGMAVSLYASAFQVGGGAVVDHVGEDGAIGDKTGLKQLAALLRDPEGQAFLRAAKTLNVRPGGRVGRREAQAAVEAYVTFLQNQEAPLRKAVSRAASFSAKIYQASMAIAEHADLIANLKEWAKAMQGDKNQPALVQRWIKDPKDTAKLVAAITDSFMRKVEAAKKPTGKKRAAADSSDDDDAASAESSGGSDSVSGRSSKSSDASDDDDSEESEPTTLKKQKGKGAPPPADRADSTADPRKRSRGAGAADDVEMTKAGRAPDEPASARPAASPDEDAGADDQSLKGKGKRQSHSGHSKEMKSARHGDDVEAPGEARAEDARRSSSRLSAASAAIRGAAAPTKMEKQKGKSAPPPADRDEPTKEPQKHSRRAGADAKVKDTTAGRAPTEPSVRRAAPPDDDASADDQSLVAKDKRQAHSGSAKKRARRGDVADAPDKPRAEEARRPSRASETTGAGAAKSPSKQAVLPLETPAIHLNVVEMEAALDKWHGDPLVEASAAAESALKGPASLEEVHDLIAEVPPSLMQAVGLGAWGRCVLDMPTDPGPACCAAYLRVIREVLHEAVKLYRRRDPKEGPPQLSPVRPQRAGEASAAEGELDAEGSEAVAPTPKARAAPVVDLESETPPRAAAGDDGVVRRPEPSSPPRAAEAIRSGTAAAAPRPPPGPAPPEAFAASAGTPPRRQAPRGPEPSRPPRAAEAVRSGTAAVAPRPPPGPPPPEAFAASAGTPPRRLAPRGPEL